MAQGMKFKPIFKLRDTRAFKPDPHHVPWDAKSFIRWVELVRRNRK